MSKTISLKNNSGKPLHKMEEEEIRKMVIEQADRMLNSVPKELKVSQVNAVRLESSMKEAADWGAWAQWTRACCDRRNRIEEFTDPAIDDLRLGDIQLEKTVFQNHFDSNFSVRQVTEAASIKKINARRKK